MNIGSTSYAVASFVYFAFFLVLLTDKHRGINKMLLFAATLLSSIWALSVTLDLLGMNSAFVSDYLSIVKNAAWLMFIFTLITYQRASIEGDRVDNIFATLGSIVALIVISVVIYISLTSDVNSKSVLFYSIHLLMAIAGIVSIEQLYRNASLEKRWVIKFLCLGLLSTFLYEFYMYSDALLYQRVDNVLWETRGFIYILLVPLVAYSVMKDPLWSPEIFLSRRVVFHTTTLLASALYLFVMGLAGFYVKKYGGNWGAVMQALLLFTTIVILAIFLSSRRIRAKIKVFLNKHFYPYKYDYREEWLRLISTISSSTARLYPESVRAIAQIIDSPAGTLWINTGHGYFECVAGLDKETISIKQPSRSSLPRFLQVNEFVINVDEYQDSPEVYNRLGNLELPDWVFQEKAWLIVPLIHIDSLIGFIVLDHAVMTKKHFNWEDSDLLKTAARQVASYISQQKISVALAEAKQFERFNKISTYIVHDIKNLVTQLSLIVSNAERHKNNPLFMQDAIRTIDNTVVKMHKLLNVVSNRSLDNHTNTHRFNVIELLGELVDMKQIANKQPIPKLECTDTEAWVRADKDQLLAIFGHLVQNAQDATAEDGSVRIIEQTNDHGDIELKFVDTGTGMSEHFIKNTLFKPFKSTKGGKGMGIGVYETREIISALGGTIDVISEVDKGTTFMITLASANASK